MRPGLRALPALCVALASPEPAAAQAAFTAQARSVEASSQREMWLWEEGTNPGPPDYDDPKVIVPAEDSDLQEAPGFGGFSATASSSGPVVAGVAGPTTSASASQTSALGPGAITASGSSAVDGQSWVVSAQELATVNALLQPPVPYFFGFVKAPEAGQSGFSVDFALSQPTAYHLVGDLTFSEAPTWTVAGSSGFIDLSGPDGSVAGISLFSPNTSRSIDVQGVLDPGVYTLSAASGSGFSGECLLIVSVECAEGSADGSFELSLTLAAAVVPALSPPFLALLALALTAMCAAALRRVS